MVMYVSHGLGNARLRGPRILDSGDEVWSQGAIVYLSIYVGLYIFVMVYIYIYICFQQWFTAEAVKF